MITKRDLFVAATTLSVCVGVGAAFGQSEKRTMGSSVFDWTALQSKPTKVGERRDLFQSRTVTLDELECHVTTVNVGEASHAPHRHPDEEMIIVKEGTVQVDTAGELKTVGPGSVIFQASNVMHGMRNAGKTPATYYVIRWKSPLTPKDAPK